MKTRLLSLLAWLRATLDLRDLHYYGGLTIAAAGGWHLSPAVTMVVLGVVLAATGLILPPRSQPSD